MGPTINDATAASTFNLPLDTLSSTANAFASANGLQVESAIPQPDGTGSTSMFQCAPISLLPNAFPEVEFIKAQTIMPAFNLLVDRISRDGTFLQETLGGSVSDADPFTAKLLQLYNSIYDNSDGNNEKKPNFAKDADYLGIFRSDYMLSTAHSEDNNYHIKQVELNTIAASFAGLSCKVAELHSFLLNRYKMESSSLIDFLRTNQNAIGSSSTGSTEAVGVPVNPTLDRLPDAMKHAVDRYVERFGKEDTNPIVLFVVQDGERNTVDQRMLEIELWRKHKIPVVRRSLTQIHSDINLNPNSGMISLESTKQEIALIYYRAGYAPTDYPDGYNGIQWDSREILERSRATKCPSLGYHLAGTKKVQQALARPGIVEKFFDASNPDEVQYVYNMRQSFAGLYSLDENDITPEDYKAIDKVLNTEDGRKLYVLKPQREGGGYNFYGDNLYQKLIDNVVKRDESSASATTSTATSTIHLSKELGEYILMERLFPPQQNAILLRNGRVEGVGETISELGCFGTVLVSSDGMHVLRNEYAGFLLRTKFSTVDEGGVASGFATLSSPYLC